MTTGVLLQLARRRPAAEPAPDRPISKEDFLLVATTVFTVVRRGAVRDEHEARDIANATVRAALRAAADDDSELPAPASGARRSGAPVVYLNAMDTGQALRDGFLTVQPVADPTP